MTILSPEVTARLAAAEKLQNNYTPNESTARQIGDKALIMLVGPAAIGKTYVMHHTAKLDANFGLVPVFTTREPRPDDDPDLFDYFKHDDKDLTHILDNIDKGVPVQYAVHPESKNIYGTNLKDYPHKYNMLATLSGAVDGMRKLPFEDTVTIGLVSSAPAWAYRFAERYPDSSDIRIKRRAEAIKSLKWLLSQEPGSIVWIENQNGHAEAAARQIVDAAYNREVQFDGRKQAELMLMTAETLGD